MSVKAMYTLFKILMIVLFVLALILALGVGRSEGGHCATPGVVVKSPSSYGHGHYKKVALDHYYEPTVTFFQYVQPLYVPVELQPQPQPRQSPEPPLLSSPPKADWGELPQLGDQSSGGLEILKAKCARCHSGARSRGGVELFDEGGLNFVGKSDPVEVHYAVHKNRMPPSGGLSDDEKLDIRKFLLGN